MTIHLEPPSPEASRDLPGQRAGNDPGPEGPCRPYSVLLPVGFAVPPPLPEARCALTAPFHPCVSLAGGRGLFSVALFPEVLAVARHSPAGRYPAPHVHGARTFLSRPPFGIGLKRPSGRLTH